MAENVPQISNVLDRMTNPNHSVPNGKAIRNLRRDHELTQDSFKKELIKKGVTFNLSHVENTQSTVKPRTKITDNEIEAILSVFREEALEKKKKVPEVTREMILLYDGRAGKPVTSNLDCDKILNSICNVVFHHRKHSGDLTLDSIDFIVKAGRLGELLDMLEVEHKKIRAIAKSRSNDNDAHRSTFDVSWLTALNTKGRKEVPSHIPILLLYAISKMLSYPLSSFLCDSSPEKKYILEIEKESPHPR